MFLSIPEALHFLTRRQKIFYFFLVAVRAFSGVLDVLGIALIGLMAGLATSSFQSGKNVSIFGITIPKVNESFLLVLVIVVLFLFIAKALIAITLSRAIAFFLARLETQISLEIVEYLFSGDLNYINKFSKGHILWAVTGSTNVAITAVLMALTSIISEGVLLTLIATTFALVDPMATLYVFAYFGFVIFGLQLVIAKSLKKAGREASEGSVQSTTALEDLISAFRETKVLGKTSFYIEKFAISRRKLAGANSSMIFLSGMPRYVVETALIFGVVIFVGFQFLSGQLAQGFVIVGVFLTGGVRIMASLLPLQAAIANLKSQREQAKSAMEILKEMPSSAFMKLDKYLSENTDAKARKTGPIGLSIESVSYAYSEQSSPAISNLTLKVSPGQHVAIIGPSGAGKTTLVDMVLGLISSFQGKINYTEIDGSPIETLVGRVSYVPQKPGMVSGTIAQNVALGVKSSELDEPKILGALEAAHLLQHVESLPEGMHTSIGEQNNALSGGQLQRLGLARALYEEPDLIILDEATSALDASSEAAITEGLKQLGSKVTVIVIAHRLSTVQHSDQVFVLENGTLSASGTFSELKRSVPMVAEYVRLMSFDD